MKKKKSQTKQTKPIKPTGLNFAKLPPLDQRYTEDELIDAIKRNCGLVTYICNELDCTGGQFYKALQKNPYLAEVQQSCKEQALDLAEHTIIKQMKNNDSEKAAMFVLKTKGKSRGWSETQDINLNVNLSEDEKIAKIKEIFNLNDEEQKEDTDDTDDVTNNTNESTDTTGDAQ